MYGPSRGVVTVCGDRRAGQAIVIGFVVVGTDIVTARGEDLGTSITVTGHIIADVALRRCMVGLGSYAMWSESAWASLRCLDPGSYLVTRRGDRVWFWGRLTFVAQRPRMS